MFWNPKAPETSANSEEIKLCPCECSHGMLVEHAPYFQHGLRVSGGKTLIRMSRGLRQSSQARTLQWGLLGSGAKDEIITAIRCKSAFTAGKSRPTGMPTELLWDGQKQHRSVWHEGVGVHGTQGRNLGSGGDRRRTASRGSLAKPHLLHHGMGGRPASPGFPPASTSFGIHSDFNMHSEPHMLALKGSVGSPPGS